MQTFAAQVDLTGLNRSNNLFKILNGFKIIGWFSPILRLTLNVTQNCLHWSATNLTFQLLWAFEVVSAYEVIRSNNLTPITMITPPLWCQNTGCTRVEGENKVLINGERGGRTEEWQMKTECMNMDGGERQPLRDIMGKYGCFIQRCQERIDWQ